MSWVKVFAQLEDDVTQAIKSTGVTSQGEGLFKRHKESSIDYEGQVRHGINVVFKEPIHKFLARIRDKPYFRKLDAWEEPPKSATRGGSALSTMKKDTKQKTIGHLRFS